MSKMVAEIADQILDRPYRINNYFKNLARILSTKNILGQFGWTHC